MAITTNDLPELAKLLCQQAIDKSKEKGREGWDDGNPNTEEGLWDLLEFAASDGAFSEVICYAAMLRAIVINKA